MIVAGCDVGAGAVKLALLEVQTQTVCFSHMERIRRRHPSAVVASCFAAAEQAGFPEAHLAYIASTGEGQAVYNRTGHFYGMTCHARGARYFFSDTSAVLDMGALHLRAMKLDGRGKVTACKMTSQCASGTGQFIENIARHLGLTLSQMSELSLLSQNPCVLSTTCVVLAETDVINMVSKNAPLPDIIRGIHDTVSQKAVTLLSAFDVVPPLTLTGGLAMDKGLIAALEAKLRAEGFTISARSHDMAIYAGAIGAALWGAWRLSQ